MLRRAAGIATVVSVTTTACAASQRRCLDVTERNLATDGAVTEFPLPNPGSAPITIAIAPDGTVWFTQSAGNRIGRMNPDGSGLVEYPLPSPAGSPTNVAVVPDHNVWYTQGGALGRVTPTGVIAEFPVGAAARAIGLTAGSDRQPPSRLTNRLWFADGAGNKISHLEFR